MKREQLNSAWEVLTEEIHNVPKFKKSFPDKVIRTRELLLFAQVALVNIKSGENTDMNSHLFKLIMDLYYKQKTWR